MASYVWIVWCQYNYGTVLPTHGIYRILLCTLTHKLMWAYAAVSTQWQMQLPGLVFYFFLLFLSSVPCTINIRKTKHRSNFLRTTCFFFFTAYFNIFVLFNCFEKLDKMPTMHLFYTGTSKMEAYFMFYLQLSRRPENNILCN